MKISPVDYHYAIGDLNYGDQPTKEAIAKMNRDLAYKLIENDASLEKVGPDNESMISTAKESNGSISEEDTETRPDNVVNPSNKSVISLEKENRKNYEKKRFSFMSLYSSLNGSRSTVESRHQRSICLQLRQ